MTDMKQEDKINLPKGDVLSLPKGWEMKALDEESADILNSILELI